MRSLPNKLYLLVIIVLSSLFIYFSATPTEKPSYDNKNFSGIYWLMRRAEQKNCISFKADVLKDLAIKYAVSKAEKWWDEMFCSKFNFLFNLLEKTFISMDEFLIDICPRQNEFENIYLVENDCAFSFSWRMRCSAESIARLNPNATVFIITISQYLHDAEHVITRWLHTFPNIIPVRVDVNRLFYGTPLQKFNSRKMWTTNTDFSYAHVSDAMRLALVWQSGGTYYDSDIIATKSIPSESNVFSQESSFRIVNAFIKMKKWHPLLENAMKLFNLHYNKNVWDANGPTLLNDGIKNYCKMKDIIPTNCKDITILNHTDGIQPIHWSKTKEILFQELREGERIEKVLPKNSYGIHFNNFLTKSEKVDFRKNTLFNQLTEKYCPYIHKEWKRTLEKSAENIWKNVKK